MKYLIGAFTTFLVLLFIAIYLNLNLNYFSSNFESSNYWLLSANPNLKELNSFESFTKEIKLYNFPIETSIFAIVSYQDESLDFHDISIPWDLVNKAIYSVSKDGVTKLMTTAEAIQAVSEWRTKYTFDIFRDDPTSNKFNILKVYIHEPV